MKHNPLPDCRECSRALEDYVDGALSGTRARVLEKHIVTCQACRTPLNEMETTRTVVHSALQSFPRIAPRADFDLRVLASLEQCQQSPLMNFCDKLDAMFSRPLPKILGSSFLGIVFGLVLVIAILPGISATGTTSSTLTSKQNLIADAIPAHPYSFYAFEYRRNDAGLIREVERHPRRKLPTKEKSWNDDFSASPHSPSHGSLC